MLRKFSVLFSRRPSEAYDILVKKGEFAFDESQFRALPVFDRLYDDLTSYVNDVKTKKIPPRQLELHPPNRLGIIPSFFLRKIQEKKVQRALSSISGGTETTAFHPLSQVKGLYIWGGVGCGKTTLMNIMYDNVPAELKKHRIHFHQFMLDVHKTSHTIRFFSEEEKKRSKSLTGIHSSNRRRSADAEINLFDELAQRLIGNIELLCFDEVAVTDVADAMILKRLFTAFYRVGIVTIFTSNRPPDSLYLGGLNRGGFLPFIDLIHKMSVTYHMESKTDHRLSGTRSNTYFSPFCKEKEEQFEKLYLDCCKALPSEKKVLKVFGRDVVVNRACGNVCYFHFREICGSEMSQADYQVIAENFHTIFVNGVPQFPYNANDVKNRFLVFIDILYEYHCKLVVYAAVEPVLLQEDKNSGLLDHSSAKKLDELSQLEKELGSQLIDSSDSFFQMERCISRLIEMRSKEYLQLPHKCFSDILLNTV